MGKRGEELQAEVMDLLRRAPGPCTAYELLDKLREANPRMAPTTVYRALAALTKKGQLHRLESLNAFIPCQCEGYADASILSICGDCGQVEERIAPELLKQLSGVAKQSGFSPERHVVELHGTCANCTPGEAQE